MLIATPPLFLVRTVIDCWRCAASTHVVALVTNQLTCVEDDETSSLGEGPDDFLSLSYVESMPDELLAAVRQFAPNFGAAESATARTAYFANHCEHCGILQGDHFVHGTPGQAFFPTDEQHVGIVAHTLAYSVQFATEACWGMSSVLDGVLRAHLGVQPRPTKRKGKRAG